MKHLNKLDIKNFISFNKVSFDIELTYEFFGLPIGDSPVVPQGTKPFYPLFIKYSTILDKEV